MIYKQPLVVNVNIEFTSLVDGVMAFGDTAGDAQIPSYESSAYSTIDQILPVNSASQSIDGSVLPTVVPTLGGIIRSFQPVQMSGLTFGYGPQQSTRDDVMIGGNGSSGGSFGGIFESLFSPFDEVYTQATSGAMSQGGFGGFLGSIAETATSVARGVSAVTTVVSGTVRAASGLAKLVGGSAYSNSKFGKSVDTFNKNMIGYGRTATKMAGATASVANTLRRTTDKFGSLFKTPVKK